MDLFDVAWLFMAAVLGVALPFGIGAIARELRDGARRRRKATPPKRGPATRQRAVTKVRRHVAQPEAGE
jgi:hypothetical protein